MNLGFLKAIKIHDCHPCILSFSFAIRYALPILRYYFVTFYLTIHTFLSLVIHLRLLKIDCRLSNSNIDSFYCSAHRKTYTLIRVCFFVFFLLLFLFFSLVFFFSCSPCLVSPCATHRKTTMTMMIIIAA